MLSVLKYSLASISLIVLVGCQAGTLRTGSINSSDRSHDILVKMPRGAPNIASDYGARRSVNGGVRRFVHDGIDIVAPRGHPILAPMDGVVSAVLKTPKNGLIVYIDHGTVDGLQPFTTYYFHLDSASVVDRQTVVRGQMIGRVGNSGYTATEVTHLHFGVLSGHRNPHEFWIGGEGIIVCFEEGREYHPKGASVLTYPVECIDEP